MEKKKLSILILIIGGLSILVLFKLIQSGIIKPFCTEKIEVTLENGEKLTLYRYPWKEGYTKNLSDPYFYIITFESYTVLYFKKDGSSDFDIKHFYALRKCIK